MSSYTLKLHVEHPGTPYSSSTGEIVRSPAGHVWFEVTGPDGSSRQSGFAPKYAKSGTASAPGEVFHDDGKNYHGAPGFTAQYDITEAQATTLRQFHANPDQFGFDTYNYHALTNSCVDFVWKALEVIGMNPLGKHGDVLPIDNIDDFMRLKNPAMGSGMPSPVSSFNDAWDSLRTPDSFPMLPWEIAFEEEEPQGTITIGPLGRPVPVVPDEMDFGAPTRQGTVTVGALGTPQPIAEPTWSGFQYGDCLVMDDPTPGIDRSDHSICRQFYSSISVKSLHQPLFRMGESALTASGRNDFSSQWLA